MGRPMVTPKEMGKIAKRNGINAPTLDENLSRWLTRFATEKKIDHYVHWWEGWYEALDESLAFQNVSFTKKVRQTSFIDQF